MPHDVFVSYAHADDECPRGAEFGWVTTFKEELRKRLQMKIGAQGADIWMDHQLTSNDRVTPTLMQTVRESRTIVLFMSKGYLRSRWCQAEINGFLEENSAYKNKESVFVVAMDETNREDWPLRVQELTPIEFFKRSLTGAIELLGYPNPPAESGSAYWTKLNELAHLIVKHLEQLGTVSRTTASSAQRLLPAVWIAQPTDDLHTEWELLASAIRQHGADVRPHGHSTYSRSDISVFRSAIEADIAGAVLLVQLLSATPGDTFAQGAGNTNSIQSALARLHIEMNPSITFLKWRSQEIDLEYIADTHHKELLQGAIACGFEQFRQHVVGEIDRLRDREEVPQSRNKVLKSRNKVLKSRNKVLKSRNKVLSLCITGGPRDIVLSKKIIDIVEGMGHVAFPAPHAPGPNESPADYRKLFEELLSDTDGVILVYGDESEMWFRSRHAQARKVLARIRHGIWGAVLDGPPPTKPSLVCADPAVLILDCRQGVRPEPIQPFIDTLSGGASV
jgi:hypothetical protein